MTDEATFVPEEHMRRKRDAYWEDLVGGVTGAYKTRQVQQLLRDWRVPEDSAIVDVGAGTSYLSKMLAEMGEASRIVCLDYDEAIIEDMRSRETDPRVEWRVGDARELATWTERVGAVTFFDVVHEVYSFVGRVDGRPRPSMHERGIVAVEEILTAAAKALVEGGVLLITDDVIPEEDGDVTGPRASPEHVAATVRRMQAEYRSRDLEITWQATTRSRCRSAPSPPCSRSTTSPRRATRRAGPWSRWRSTST